MGRNLYMLGIGLGIRAAFLDAIAVANCKTATNTNGPTSTAPNGSFFALRVTLTIASGQARLVAWIVELMQHWTCGPLAQAWFPARSSGWWTTGKV